jgi:hypothetical protein
MAPNNSENREPMGQMIGTGADTQSKSRLFAEY